MTEMQAAELAMAIDTVGGSHNVRVVDGSGFTGTCGTCFAVELAGGDRRLITCEEDWKKVAHEIRRYTPPSRTGHLQLDL